ncbi:MAG TPA: ATP-binding protein [bacterium]|nr:ATP-binding protein [bacterium]
MTTEGSSRDGYDRVEIAIPVRPEFVSVARLTAATVAARQGFTYDEIEDLKIAVGEACTALIIARPDSRQPLTTAFVLAPDAIEVRVAARVAAPAWAQDGAAPATSDAPIDESRLGMFLMQCLVDEVEARHDRESGLTELRLLKHRLS